MTTPLLPEDGGSGSKIIGSLSGASAGAEFDVVGELLGMGRSGGTMVEF
jgi:hypothetical protein